MKTAVIIGATGGIGRVISRGLAEAGWNLGLTGTTSNKLEGAFADLDKNSSGNITLAPVDLSNPDPAALKKLAASFSHVDLLVNTAGIHHPGSWELSEEKIAALIDVNVMGPVRVLKTFLPAMIQRGSGTVINISSRRGRVATPEEGAYSLSKHALSGLGDALYKELSPKGIKVTTICPGWVFTEMAERAPLKPHEMIQAQDILEAILFIEKLSPAASVKEILLEPGKNITR